MTITINSSTTTSQITSAQQGDIQSISLSTLQVLTTDQINAFNTQQIQYFNTLQINAFKTDQIQAINYTKIYALTTEQIVAISTANINALLPTQIPVLTSVQIIAFNQTNLLTLATKYLSSFLPHQLNVFTSSEVSSLIVNQLSLLTPTQIYGFSQSQVNSLTNTQKNALNYNGSICSVSFDNTTANTGLDSSFYITALNDRVSGFPTIQATYVTQPSNGKSNTYSKALHIFDGAALTIYNTIALKFIPFTTFTIYYEFYLINNNYHNYGHMIALYGRNIPVGGPPRLFINIFDGRYLELYYNGRTLNTGILNNSMFTIPRLTAQIWYTMIVSLSANSIGISIYPSNTIFNLQNTILITPSIIPSSIPTPFPLDIDGFFTSIVPLSQIVSGPQTYYLNLIMNPSPAYEKYISNLQIYNYNLLNTYSNLNSLTTYQISQLTTEQVINLSTSDIHAFTSDQIIYLDTADIQVLLTSQLRAITNNNIIAMNTTFISTLSSYQIATLLVSQINSITTLQLNIINTSQIIALTTYQINNLSLSNIQNLSTAQFSSFTTLELSSLTFTQKSVINTAQFAAN